MQGELETSEEALTKAPKFSEKEVFESELYILKNERLNVPHLADNRFFVNLTRRLKRFYLHAEKIRVLGPTTH
jgi:hypothetical protein